MSEEMREGNVTETIPAIEETDVTETILQIARIDVTGNEVDEP